jgi:peptidoglycan/LPS O-acetylase OafA/YrhL
MLAATDFRASASAYAVLCGPFVALALLAARSAMWNAFAICLAIAVIWAVWLAWFRLHLGEDSFTYRSPFRRSRTVPYDLVSDVGVTARGPASGATLGVAVRVSDGSYVKVNFKVLPRQAGILLMKRIHT